MTKAHPVEGDVKKEIKKLFEKYGWFHFMPASNTFGVNGISDHIAIKAGIFMCVEAKLAKGEGSELQEAFLAKVREHGGYGIVVNQKTLPKFAAMLERLDKVIDARQLAAMQRKGS